MKELIEDYHDRGYTYLGSFLFLKDGRGYVLRENDLGYPSMHPVAAIEGGHATTMDMLKAGQLDTLYAESNDCTLSASQRSAWTLPVDQEC